MQENTRDPSDKLQNLVKHKYRKRSIDEGKKDRFMLLVSPLPQAQVCTFNRGEGELIGHPTLLWNPVPGQISQAQPSGMAL